MSLATAAKAQIIKTYGRSKADTGSSEVQIALLTAHIQSLTRDTYTNVMFCGAGTGSMLMLA